MTKSKDSGKYNPALIVPAILVLAAFAAGMAVLTACKDAIVIRNSILFYRRLRNAVMMIGIPLSVIALILLGWELIRPMFRKKKQMEETARRMADEEEAQRMQAQEKKVLSVSKKIDSQRIQALLAQYSAGEWRAQAQSLQRLRIQLEMMDEQQERLAHLLENNGAETLSNTQEVLDRVEQYLCKSVRKVINYMDVADPDRADDVRRVEEKAAACYAEGQKQLQQVQEFLFTMADFLNSQGDDDNSIQLLELYKNTILDSIQE